MTTTVTASEFQKNFGQYKEFAQCEPINVSSNGRESVVLLSASEYKEYEAVGKIGDTPKQLQLTTQMVTPYCILPIIGSFCHFLCASGP